MIFLFSGYVSTVISQVVLRSIAITRASLPKTTACSPEKIHFPGAENLIVPYFSIPTNKLYIDNIIIQLKKAKCNLDIVLIFSKLWGKKIYMESLNLRKRILQNAFKQKILQ